MRSALLSGYDRMVVAEGGRVTPHSSAGTDVTVRLTLTSAALRSRTPSHMRVAFGVLLELWWIDERLAWAPGQTASHAGALLVAADDVWTPDVSFYSDFSPTPLHTSLVRLASAGALYSTRVGTVDVACAHGTRCELELGGWALSGELQGIVPQQPRPVVHAAPAPAAAAFVDAAAAQQVVYEYTCCPSQPWPVIRYAVDMALPSLSPLLPPSAPPSAPPTPPQPLSPPPGHAGGLSARTMVWIILGAAFLIAVTGTVGIIMRPKEHAPTSGTEMARPVAVVTGVPTVTGVSTVSMVTGVPTSSTTSDFANF
jgi:hypothetical protein